MFDRFRTTYGSRRDDFEAGAAYVHSHLSSVAGYGAFAREFAGASFGGGLYRVHDDVTGPRALSLVADAFPGFARRVCPFGYDWLGRQFAVDLARVVSGEPQVLLLEPGTSQALEISADFRTFHDDEMVDHTDAAVASGFFIAWSRANADQLPLLRSQCAGYKIPLFLGGADVEENLEVSDIDVYWTVLGQIRRQTT